MTESGGAESSSGESIELFMSIVGYEIVYGRSTDSSEPPQPTSSWIQVNMSTKDAFIEHFGRQKPIKRAIVVFTERGLEENRVGNLFFEEDFPTAAIFARLPYVDFPGFWAALRLDRVARLGIIVNTGTFDVSTLQFLSQGSLFPLFGI
jgi:hypothetical protein